MALYENLPVYKAAYDLLAYIYRMSTNVYETTGTRSARS
jgi:hypothetical protein